VYAGTAAVHGRAAKRSAAARRPAIIAATTANRQRLPRVVVVLGLVSFCNDLASEMVTPLIPILLSAIPGFAAGAEPVPPAPLLAWRFVAPPLRCNFAVLAVFTLARASETFIVLRGHELAMTVPQLLLLWAAVSFAKALSAWTGGRLGHRRIVLLHGASFLLRALSAAALVFGVCAGFGEGAERALVGDLGRDGARGTAFGWYNMTLGLAAIPGGLFFGGLWQAFGAAAAFAGAAALAWLAALLLQAAVPRTE